MVAGAGSSILGMDEGATELLAITPTGAIPAILVHSKAGLADDVATKQGLRLRGKRFSRYCRWI